MLRTLGLRFLHSAAGMSVAARGGGGAGHWPLRWKLCWAAAFSGDMPSSELPPRASPTPPPGPHQPLCICHQSALLPLDEALFGGDWQAARVCRGGGDAHCCRQCFMGYMVTHTSSIPAPAVAPSSRRFRAQNNQARPRTAPSSSHPLLTHSFHPKGKHTRQE